MVYFVQYYGILQPFLLIFVHKEMFFRLNHIWMGFGSQWNCRMLLELLQGSSSISVVKSSTGEDCLSSADHKQHICCSNAGIFSHKKTSSLWRISLCPRKRWDRRSCLFLCRTLL